MEALATALLSLLLLAQAPAQALRCGLATEPEIAQQLASEWGEGERARSRTPAGELVLYENAQTHTWTVVLFPSAQPGVACAAGAGEGTPPAFGGRES